MSHRLMFNSKDELQQRWTKLNCGHIIHTLRHTLPSSQAFVAAALGGLGWAIHPEDLVREHLECGALVELKLSSPLDILLYWQHGQMASSLLSDLTAAVLQ
jgi:LysR family transcriptional regulator (chromosome initiation inhibitor)